jgi:hypothetical protein
MILGGAALGIGGLVGGGLFGSSGAKKQLALMRDALNYQKGIDQRTYTDLSPYRDFGKNQLNDLSSFMATKNPSNYIDPGYQFRLDAGTKAIGNNAAAAGMLQSGDTLRALTEYGQSMGSQEYNNAFNRFLGEGQFRQGLAGMGQNAAFQGGQLANQGAQNVGQISANTDAGASDRIWGNVVSGIGGMAGNAVAGGAGGGFSNAFSNIFKKPPQYAGGNQYAGGRFPSSVGV